MRDIDWVKLTGWVVMLTICLACWSVVMKAIWNFIF